MTIHHVTNAAELEAAFAAASDGDRIELAAGDYDAVLLKNQSFSEAVTITSADPDAQAVLTHSLHMANVSGVVVEGVDINGDSLAAHYNWARLKISNSQDVVVRDMDITGHIPTVDEGVDPLAEDASRADPLVGYGFEWGAQLRNTEGVVLEDITMQDLRGGIALNNAIDTVLTDMELAGLREGINLHDIRNLEISDSYFHDFSAWQRDDQPGGGDHPDFIQYWGKNSLWGLDGLVVQNNMFSQPEGSRCQTIFGGLNSQEGITATGFQIIGNTIVNAQTNGIRLDDVDGFIIKDNVLLPNGTDLDFREYPAIYVSNACNGVIEGNTVMPRWWDTGQVVCDDQAVLDAASIYVDAASNTVLSTNPDSPDYWVPLYDAAMAEMEAMAKIGNDNDAPDLEAQAVTVDEDSGVAQGQLVATDSDAGDTLTFSTTATAAGFALAADGSWTFDTSDPAYQSLSEGRSMTLTIPVMVMDAAGEADTEVLSITITGTNDVPVLTAAQATATEAGGQVSGQMVASDVDQGDTVTFSAATLPAGFTLAADGSWTLDTSDAAYEALAEGQVAVLTVQVTVTDGAGATATEVLSITLVGTNDAPVLVAAQAVADEDSGTVTGQMVATDVDAGDTLSFATTAAPAGFALATDGSWTLDTSDPAYTALLVGEQMVLDIPVTVTDAAGASATQTLSITVSGAAVLFQGTAGDDVLRNTDSAVNLEGARFVGEAGDDRIYDTDGSDYLEGGDGADMLVFDYRKNAGGAQTDTIADLDFDEGDAIRLVGNQDGTFSDDADPGNPMIVSADGASVLIRSMADLREAAQSGGLHLQDSASGDSLLIHLAEAPDQVIEILNKSMDDVTGTSMAPPPVVAPAPVPGADDDDTLAPTIQGTAGDDRLIDTAGDDVIEGGDGADMIVIDYRKNTGPEAEVITDLNFDEGDVLRLMTSNAGTFDNDVDATNNMLVSADGSDVFIRGLDDLKEAAAGGGLQLQNSDTGDSLVITFTDMDDHSIELLEVTEEDLQF